MKWLIATPTLVIGGKFDTMDPDYLEKMTHELKKARHVVCPHGSHMSISRSTRRA